MIAKLCLIGVAVLALTIGLFQAATYWTKDVRGKVIRADTGLPIENAFVAVESGFDWEEQGIGSYVKTDADGQFTAKARGSASIRIWKQGYALGGILVPNVADLDRHGVVIRVRELSASSLIPENNDREGWGAGDGFSFQQGKIVAADSEQADIALVDSGQGELFVESRGNGGLVYQAYDEAHDLYNTPEAPISGYESRLPLNTGMGLYYVKTRDGKHYAKVRVMRGQKMTQHGSDFSYYWLNWAFQPDGTRDLEIEPTKLPFPFFKFGIKPTR